MNNLDNILKILEKQNIFITGGGGVGKSYLVNQLKERIPLILTSTTGISAVNICGQTIHSWAGIGVCDRPVERVLSYLRSPKRRTKLNEIRDASFLVIDEISMLNSYTLDYLNEVLKQARNNNKPFGGIRVILTGDFFQLPPVKIGQVVKLGEQNIKVDFCYKSATWKELNLHTILLEKVYRQDDPAFVHALNNVRIGSCTQDDFKLLSSRNLGTTVDVPKDAVKLYSLNSKADEENQKRFQELNGKPRKFVADDKMRTYVNGTSQMVKPTQANLSEWDWKKWTLFNSNCRIPEVLELKVGARVMLLSNWDFERRLVNGSCGNVIKISSDSVNVAFDNGEEEWITPEPLEITEGKKVKISRLQLPLRLAYAITIHKSQGMSIDKVFIDFDKIFAEGQAYVALSRARTLEGLYLKHFTQRVIFANNDVKKFYDKLKKDSNKLAIV